MIKVESKIIQKKIEYKGFIILKYKIIYPQIRGYDKFNIYNYSKAAKLQNMCENELLEKSKLVCEENIKNGYQNRTFEVNSEFLITYNYNNIISLYIDEYSYTAGAHGNTIRTSQNWNLIEEKTIPLQEFYKRNPNYVSTILKNINNQITKNVKDGNNIYFDNYCCLTAANFRVENYYMFDEFLIFYFQQYDIAPYSSGILIFFVKY